MSANDHTSAHEEAHSGPIKTPSQFLAAALFFFVVPVFVIIGLVYYVASAGKPMAGADDGGRAVAQRIQKIGMVEIRDANRPLRPGEEVYKAQCVACHSSGAAGAPKFGDVSAWAPRIATGYDKLLTSALKGKGAMAAQGGGDFQDVEIGRAVVYLTNAAGGKFAEPAVPAAGATADAAPAAQAAPVAMAAPAAPVAAAAAASVQVAAANPGAGEALYKQACLACHAAGVAGAPKFGDKAAWAPRIQTGIDALTASVVKGKGAMPPKGGSAASDADLRSAVVFMVDAAK